MNGRRAKLLRKQALALHPEGSSLAFQVTKVDPEGNPVRGNWQYTSGFKRVYKDLKRSHKNGEHI
jgi:hypothetical protein